MRWARALAGLRKRPTVRGIREPRRWRAVLALGEALQPGGEHGRHLGFSRGCQIKTALPSARGCQPRCAARMNACRTDRAVAVSFKRGVAGPNGAAVVIAPPLRRPFFEEAFGRLANARDRAQSADDSRLDGDAGECLRWLMRCAGTATSGAARADARGSAAGRAPRRDGVERRLQCPHLGRR